MHDPKLIQKNGGKVKILVKKDLGGKYRAGSTHKVDILPSGVLKDAFLRRRLKDAAIDDCAEIVREQVKAKVKEKPVPELEKSENKKSSKDKKYKQDAGGNK